MNRNRLLTENVSSRNGLNNSFLNKKNVSSSSFELKFSFLTFSIKFEVMCVLTKIDQFPLLSQIFCYKEWFSGFVWHYNFWYNLCDLLRPIIHNHYECVMVSVHNNRTAQWLDGGRDHLGNYLLSQGTIFTMINILTTATY